MPPASSNVGPLERALREALESVAAPSQQKAVIDEALRAARLTEVPHDAALFQRFVYGAFGSALVRVLGEDTAELVRDQLAHVMAMVGQRSVGAAKVAGGGAWAPADEDWEAGSGEVAVEGTAARSGSRLRDGSSDRGGSSEREHAVSERDRMGHAPTMPPPPDVMPRGLGRPSMGTSPTLPAMRPATSSGSFPRRTLPGTSPGFDAAPQTRQVVGRVTRQTLGGVAEVRSSTRPARALATDVFVLSLDEQLHRELETRLKGLSRIVAVVTLDELERQLLEAKNRRTAVVVDAALPSIDLPTLARAAGRLPTTALVLVWGMEERQRQRLVGAFPETMMWIPLAASRSPADALLDV